MTDLLKAVAAVRELLADQRHWTRDADARDAGGEPVDPLDDRARCFCISGAFIHIANPATAGYKSFLRLVSRALRDLGCAPHEDAWSFNDRPQTTHAQVMQLLDRVAELAAHEESRDQADMGGNIVAFPAGRSRGRQLH